MQVVILAGGFGTRLSEETAIIPKPMVAIGSQPILWHIMQIYSQFGFRDFIISAGYKSEVIKAYFHNYFLSSPSIEFDLKSGSFRVLDPKFEDWNVRVVDTGLNVSTGGRIKLIDDYLVGDDFLMTYGDGLGNVNISQVVHHHKNQKALATVTAVYPPPRFGGLNIVGNIVTEFVEKPLGDGGRVNGGFFVLNRYVMNYIDSLDESWEEGALTRLARERQLSAFSHNGFWHPMDTLRDKRYLSELASNSPKLPWLEF